MKKLTAITLVLIITMALGVACASEPFTEQDEILIKFSAQANKAFVENDIFSEINYVFTAEEFQVEKTTVLIDNETSSVMIASTNYCSWWMFDNYSDFSTFSSLFSSDDAMALFSVTYSD